MLKKLSLIALILCLNSFDTSAADRFGKKRKNGTYQRKSGFLGIFGKKRSQCDCPRH